MPLSVERIEYGIYHLRVWGILTYDHVIEALRQNTETQEVFKVFILDRAPDTQVNLSFSQIRQLSTGQNLQQRHYIHLDTGIATRIFIQGVNRISRMNITLAPSMDCAIDDARRILHRQSTGQTS